METKRQKERCGKRKMLLYDEEENLVHRLLKCKETPRWREQFLDNTRLYTNEDREYNKNNHPSRTKRELLYLKTQSIPRSRNFSSRL